MNHWYVTLGIYLLWTIDIALSLYGRKLKKEHMAIEREILSYRRADDTLLAYRVFTTAAPCWQHENEQGTTDYDREFLHGMRVSL